VFDDFQGVVKRPIRLRLANLYEWDFDDGRAQAAQTGGEAAGLVAGASD
jgi:hypothetical protein